MVTIFYTKFDISRAAMYFRWLPLLPESLRLLNLQYRREEDRIRNLLGKVLLIEALKRLGYGNYSLELLLYNQFGKPYFSNGFDFNITHSGEYIFCAMQDGSKLGIDVEQIKDLNFSHLKSSMSEDEWCIINKNMYPLDIYYKLWTMKEAAVKADGRGFSICPNQIEIISNCHILIGNTLWYLKEIKFDMSYYCFLAVLSPDIHIDMIYLDLI